MIAGGNALVVDVRNTSELQASGKIAGGDACLARHAGVQGGTRASPYHDPAFARPTERSLLFYCASGGRSALAGKALQDLGYKDVRNLGVRSRTGPRMAARSSRSRRADQGQPPHTAAAGSTTSRARMATTAPPMISAAPASVVGEGDLPEEHQPQHRRPHERRVLDGTQAAGLGAAVGPGQAMWPLVPSRPISTNQAQRAVPATSRPSAERGHQEGRECVLQQHDGGDGVARRAPISGSPWRSHRTVPRWRRDASSVAVPERLQLARTARSARPRKADADRRQHARARPLAQARSEPAARS